MTGLNNEQLTDLVARLHELCGDKFVSAGPPLALGLFRSVALVVVRSRKSCGARMTVRRHSWCDTPGRDA
jgi:hypothetical protein